MWCEEICDILFPFFSCSSFSFMGGGGIGGGNRGGAGWRQLSEGRWVVAVVELGGSGWQQRGLLVAALEGWQLAAPQWWCSITSWGHGMAAMFRRVLYGVRKSVKFCSPFFSVVPLLMHGRRQCWQWQLWWCGLAAAFGRTMGSGGGGVGRQRTAVEAVACGEIGGAAVGCATAVVWRTVMGTRHVGHVEDYLCVV